MDSFSLTIFLSLVYCARYNSWRDYNLTSSSGCCKSVADRRGSQSLPLPLQGNIDESPGNSTGAPVYEHRIVYIWCFGCGEYKKVKMKCGHRSCPVCRKGDYYRLLRQYSQPLAQYQKDNKIGIGEFKLLTLTMMPVRPSVNDDMTVKKVRQVIVQLRDAFSRMRRFKKYAYILRGGLRSIEPKFTDKGEWFVHAHIVYEGAYHPVCCEEMKNANTRDQENIVEAQRCVKCVDKCFRYDWKKVSGNPVVHVKRAYTPVSGLRYILKYVSKPPEVAGQYEMYDQIVKGMRMIQPFGCWFGMKLVESKMICDFCGYDQWISEFQIEKIWDSFGKKDVRVRGKPRPGVIFDKQLALDLGYVGLRHVAGRRCA